MHAASCALPPHHEHPVARPFLGRRPVPLRPFRLERTRALTSRLQPCAFAGCHRSALPAAHDSQVGASAVLVHAVPAHLPTRAARALCTLLTFARVRVSAGPELASLSTHRPHRRAQGRAAPRFVDSVDSVDGVDGDGPVGRMTRRMLDAPTPIYEDSMGVELVDNEEALLSDRTL